MQLFKDCGNSQQGQPRYEKKNMNSLLRQDAQKATLNLKNKMGYVTEYGCSVPVPPKILQINPYQIFMWIYDQID